MWEKRTWHWEKSVRLLRCQLQSHWSDATFSTARAWLCGPKTLLVLVHYAEGRRHLLLKKFHTSDFLVVFHATQLLPCLNDMADSIVGDCLDHGEFGLDEEKWENSCAIETGGKTTVCGLLPGIMVRFGSIDRDFTLLRCLFFPEALRSFSDIWSLHIVSFSHRCPKESLLGFFSPMKTSTTLPFARLVFFPFLEGYCFVPSTELRSDMPSKRGPSHLRMIFWS